MKDYGKFAIGVICGAALTMLPKAIVQLHGAVRGAHGTDAHLQTPRAHTEEKFSFTAHAPMEQVGPLFGADRERVWAPDWDPDFVHPLPPADAQGMVFTAAHRHRLSIWANTAFDLKNGHVQYVYVIPDILLTVITLDLQPQGNRTHVEVHYDRTALSPDGDAHVADMAKQDRAAGPDWEKQINGYLQSR
jgi:hypothetical protein